MERGGHLAHFTDSEITDHRTVASLEDRVPNLQREEVEE